MELNFPPNAYVDSWGIKRLFEMPVIKHNKTFK